MGKECKQYGLDPEFESAFNEEFSFELLPEFELDEDFVDNKRHAIGLQYRSPFFSWLSRRDDEVSNYVTSSREKSIVQSAIAGGERNENVLSDTIFFKRHPELGGKPLYKGQSNFDSLSKEWLSIRDELVRPLLGVASSPSVGQPTTPSTAKPPAASNPLSARITLQKVLTAMRNKRYVIYEKPYQMNIVGVRAANRDANKFDDTINIFYRDDYGKWQFRSSSGTTDPGEKYLYTPIDGQTATAILKPGQYINSHQRGIHHGTTSQYLALVQRGSLTIYRDGNHDNRLDFQQGTEVSGSNFGINIHRALSSGTATTVGKFSAGCQVFANTDDFNYMMSISAEQEKRYGNNFTYTLLTERDIIASGLNAQKPSLNYPRQSNGTGTVKPSEAQAVRSGIVKIAMTECSKWGNGKRKETEPEMRKLVEQYWKEGVPNEPQNIGLAWCGAFISYIVWKASAGSKDFKYSGANTTYTYYAIQNRRQNNNNIFKAYRMIEIKPKPGDILVLNRGGSTFTYDNLLPDKSGTHAVIVTKVNSNNVEVVSGNSSDSVHTDTLALKAGYIVDPLYFAIIRVGGVSSSEIQSVQNEYEFSLGWKINPLFKSAILGEN